MDSYNINSEKFSFKPSEVDYVFVCHTHVDHIGLLPRLVKEGFNGKIIASHATAQLIKPLLYNCVFILESEANTLSFKYKRNYSPIYTEEDVKNTLNLIYEYDDIHKLFVLDDIVSFQWLENSHCVGSRQLQLILRDNNGVSQSILYTSDMISTLKGFNLDAEEAMSIIDKVNEVANTQPIDTSGLFAGLERSASSMSAANNSLDQTIALITAANSVVQDPDSIGTAFKTISMRIRGASTEMEEAGLDTEGMAESTAKLREEILALSGVDIMKNENEFKSTYDILDELSIKWSELSDISQASITELVAGKRQGNIMSALMSNFDIARETLNTAMTESSGSAEKELTNYQKGIEYSLDKFKATFQDFSTSLLDSNMVKGFVDTGASLLGGFTNIIDGIGVIQTIAGGFGAYKGISSFVKNFDSPEIMGTVNFRYLHSESGIV